MKKTISISITGVESAKMQKLQKANAAIRTLREFAQAVADARRALDKALDDLEDFIIAHTTTERKENAT